MNFGNTIGGAEFFIVLLLWVLPFVVLLWFVRTLSSIAASLREIIMRLETLERTIRDRQ